MKGPYKKYSEEFLPDEIQYLLVGESPPYTPPNEKLRYFYNYQNNTGKQILLSCVSYSFLDKKFYIKRDDKEDFLEMIMEHGIFLIDSTYHPVNQIEDRELRLDKIRESYLELKKNINGLPLENEAKILLIHNNVREAVGDKLRHDFSKYNFYDIGFPHILQR